MITLTVTVETLPDPSELRPWDGGQSAVEHRYDKVVVEAATYEEARERAFASVPDGWRVVNIRVGG